MPPAHRPRSSAQVAKRTPAAKRPARVRAQSGSAAAGTAARRYRFGVLNDLPSKLPNQPMGLILDVGANVGQTSLELAEAYPEARILAFEPAAATFVELETAVGDLPNVEARQLGLAARAGEAVMLTEGASTGFKIVSPEVLARRRGAASEEITVVSGDDWCASEGIEHIDFLKVDTAGYDLEVLRGFHGMFGAGAIDVLQVEAGMYADNPRQVAFERFRGYLEPLGYQLFGVYGQARGYRGLPVLARADVVFISAATIERNTVVK